MRRGISGLEGLVLGLEIASVIRNCRIQATVLTASHGVAVIGIGLVTVLNYCRSCQKSIQIMAAVADRGKSFHYQLGGRRMAYLGEAKECFQSWARVHRSEPNINLTEGTR